MKKLIVACMMLCGLAAPAVAADVAVLAPAYQPIPVRPLYSWTGCYVGANAGGGGAPKTWSDVNGEFSIPPNTYLGDHTARGVVGGGQLGCDYQIGSFVFGVSGLYDLTGMKGDDFQANRLLLNRSFVQSIATLTGRIGFTVHPTVLLYAKAGGAWAHDLYNIGFPASAGGSFTPSPLGIFQVIAVSFGGFPPGTIVALGKNTSGGWTAGAGIEWAMFGGDWSTSIEYNYMNFGTSRVTLLATLQPNTLFPIDIAQRAHVVLFGLNYHFLGGPPRY